MNENFQHDMFQITAIIGDKLELTHEFSDEVVYPVSASSDLGDLFSVGQVRLMEIIRDDLGWSILSASPPYEEGPSYEETIN